MEDQYPKMYYIVPFHSDRVRERERNDLVSTANSCVLDFNSAQIPDERTDSFIFASGMEMAT